MKLNKSFLSLWIIAFVLCSGLVFSAHIEVKSPNGNEKWKLGEIKQIEWTATGLTNKMKITLVKETSNTEVGVIKDNISLKTNSDSYTLDWTVGNYLGGKADTGSQYKIHIREKSTAVKDLSNSFFEIVQPSGTKHSFMFTTKPGASGKIILKKITVLSPTGGNYETGQELHIEWKTSWEIDPDDFFLLELYSGSGKRFKRVIGQNNEGWSISKPYPMIYSWTIPGDIWPEFYTIRISHQVSKKKVRNISIEPVRGFSSRFHISRSYGKARWITIYPEVANRVRISPKEGVTHSDCERERNDRIRAGHDQNPGPGDILVGFNIFNTYHDIGYHDTGRCICYYRAFVYFNLNSVPKDCILLEAKLKYHKEDKLKIYKDVGVCPSSATVFALIQKVNVNSDLWSVLTTSVNPSNLTDLAIKWIAFPETNFGFLFTGPGKYPGKSKCLLYYNRIRLVLKIKEKAK